MQFYVNACWMNYNVALLWTDGLNYGTKEVCDCATKTGRGIVFPGPYHQATVETLHYKRKRSLLMEEEMKLKERYKPR